MYTITVYDNDFVLAREIEITKYFKCVVAVYQQEGIRQLSDQTCYTKVNKDLTFANQKIVKDTIQELITKQELPVTAQNLIINTPRTSCIYFKPKIHKANNPGRPIVSACSCPTELISSYLDKVMTLSYKPQQPTIPLFALTKG